MAQSVQLPAARANAIQGLGRLPVFKQAGLLVALAASVALGAGVVLWARDPAYSPLYSNLSGKSIQQVMDALTAMDVPYKLNETDGTVLVPSKDLHRVRIKLAADGLPQDDDMGMEILGKDPGFGTSQFVERARYQHAMEIELARSIATMDAVNKARVHLALPKQSVFVRNRKKPSASVLLELASGRRLDKDQIAAITHLVASSVPNMESRDVSVVDNRGTMLTSSEDDPVSAATNSRYEFIRKVEDDYRDRVLDILLPVVGEDRLQARVTAEIDFTSLEQTRESFNPDLPALRSEQLTEQQGSPAAAAGIPGALSNQPPGAATAPERTGQAAGSDQGGGVVPSRRSSTRNYEIDRTISHTVSPTPTIRRLSVAVVVDDHKQVAGDGVIERTPLNPEEIARLTGLVKEAIGFSGQRGDTVSVVNTRFIDPPQPEPLPEVSLLDQPWVWDLARQLGAVLSVLLLVFMVLRPAMRRLTSYEVSVRSDAEAAALQGGEGGGVHRLTDQSGAAGGADGEDTIELPNNMTQERQLQTVKAVIKDDPRRAAQVFRNWINEDG